MKVGDVVMWVGFPGSSLPPEETGPSCYGLITKVIYLGLTGSDKRLNVMWGNGQLGVLLYPGTLEVICEMVNENFRNKKQA